MGLGFIAQRLHPRCLCTPMCAPRSAGHNWVDPPKRERKRVVNYAENEYFRNAMKPGGGRSTQGGPRLPKMPALQDFQFYNTQRLMQLYEQDQAYEVHKHAVAQREAAARAQVGGDCRQILLNIWGVFWGDLVALSHGMSSVLSCWLGCSTLR